MLLVEGLSQAHHEVIVLYGVRNRQNFFWDFITLEEISNLRPVENVLRGQPRLPLRGYFRLRVRRFTALRRSSAHLLKVRIASVGHNNFSLARTQVVIKDSGLCALLDRRFVGLTHVYLSARLVHDV